MSENVAHNRTFAAGQWYAVVGDQLTVLVPAEARSRVASVWDLADGGASFEAVLDGLLVDGLSSLSGFALVGHGEPTRVLLRGEVTATFSTDSGEVALAHEPDTMWAERTLVGVTGGRITTGAATAETDLALVSGVARVAAVQFGDPVSPSSPGSPEAVGPLDVIDADAQPEPEPEPEPQSESELESEHGRSLSFGAPCDDDPTPTGEQPAVAAEAAYPSEEHDGHTAVGTPLGQIDRPPVGTPGQELAPPVVSRPVARLIFSTGDVVDVDRVILIGRAPDASQFASSDQPHLIPVASPNHEISSTHLEIRPGAGADHGMAVVTDMGSTNGTVLVQPGLPPEDLQAGFAVSLIPGAILDLGDGVTIQTTNP